MHQILVRGKAVISKIGPDGNPVIVTDGAILVRDGIVVEIDLFSKLRQKCPGVDVIGTSDHIICPGFINAHHHVGITPFQLGIPDLPLELWIVRRICGRSIDPYLDTLYSAFEMVASGVTTVQHLHGRVRRPISNASDVAASVIRAYDDIGMRVSYSFGLRDQNRLVYEDDETFINSLPTPLADATRPYVAAQTFSLDESMEVFETLHGHYKNRDRVAIQLAPVNLHWCSDKAIERTAELSRKYAVPMHMHLLETPIQKEYAARRTRAGAVAHLHQLGALGPLMTLGHGVWLNESDIELIAETGTCVCHNCSSNLRLRSGTAPLNSFRKYGVRVAIGIDEAGLNDDRDFLQEMRLILRLHRRPGLDSRDVPSAAEVFRMATEHGAATTPFGETIGVLEPGRAADIAMFSWKKIATPYLNDDVPLVDALLNRAGRSAADIVLAAGKVIYQAGKFTGVDHVEVIRELQDVLRRPLSEFDLKNDELGKQLFPIAERFYGDYIGGKPSVCH